MKILTRIYDVGVELLSSLFLFVMFCVVCFGVYSRWFMARPYFWTDELARYCMFFMVMIGSATALRQNTHPALTFVTDKLRGTARFVLEMWVELLILATVILLLAGGWEMMLDARRARTAALRIYYSRVYFAIPLGAVLMGIACIGRLVTVIRSRETLVPRDAG